MTIAKCLASQREDTVLGRSTITFQGLEVGGFKIFVQMLLLYRKNVLSRCSHIFISTDKIYSSSHFSVSFLFHSSISISTSIKRILKSKRRIFGSLVGLIETKSRKVIAWYFRLAIFAWKNSGWTGI